MDWGNAIIEVRSFTADPLWSLVSCTCNPQNTLLFVACHLTFACSEISSLQAALLQHAAASSDCCWLCLQSVDRDAEGQVSRLEGSLHVEGDVKRTKLKLTWLPDSGDLVPLQLVDFDHLISKKKLEEGDDIADFVSPVSVSPGP